MWLLETTWLMEEDTESTDALLCPPPAPARFYGRVLNVPDVGVSCAKVRPCVRQAGAAAHPSPPAVRGHSLLTPTLPAYVKAALRTGLPEKPSPRPLTHQHSDLRRVQGVEILMRS